MVGEAEAAAVALEQHNRNNPLRQAAVAAVVEEEVVGGEATAEERLPFLKQSTSPRSMSTA